VKGIFRVLAGLLFIVSVYSVVLNLQSPVPGSEWYAPIATAIAGLVCVVYSIKGKTEYDEFDKKLSPWKIIFYSSLVLLCLGFAVYYFLYLFKP
jgi:heme O synthase-like polyprenyltransferase